MASEHIQRRIDRLLDQREEVADGQDWPEVNRLARQVLGLDSDNVDGPSFLNMAEAELAGQRDAQQFEKRVGSGGSPSDHRGHFTLPRDKGSFSPLALRIAVLAMPAWQEFETQSDRSG